MAGICSAHRHKEPNCKQCETHPRELFPDWDKMVAQAKAAGETTCQKCGFVFYRTTDCCPKCGSAPKMATLLTITQADEKLLGDLLHFMDDWTKQAGYFAPRYVHNLKDETIVIKAFLQ